MIEIPKPKDRTNLDLLELVCQLHSRALQYPSKKMHDAYWEARRELEARLDNAKKKTNEMKKKTKKDNKQTELSEVKELKKKVEELEQKVYISRPATRNPGIWDGVF